MENKAKEFKAVMRGLAVIAAVVLLFGMENGWFGSIVLLVLAFGPRGKGEYYTDDDNPLSTDIRCDIYGLNGYSDRRHDDD